MDKQRLRKVLCIGTNDDNLILYERILTVRNKLKNLEIIQASDGKEGLQKAIECKPDLIIVEDRLSEVGDIYFEFGFFLSVKIQDRLVSHILGVILFKSHPSRRDMTPTDEWFKWIKNPLNEMLVKPVSANELAEKVDNLLETVDRMRAQ